MSIYILTKEDSITISLENDFTFHHHADFRKAYEQNLDDKKRSLSSILLKQILSIVLP